MRGKKALAMALVLGLATACGGGGGGGVTAKKTEAAPPAVTITPANGNARARPDQGVVVKASGGTLGAVAVTLKGKPVPGALSPDKTTWRSSWTLAPGGSYQVQATATSAEGRTTTATSAFRTTTAVAATRINNVVPSPGETVGTGMPIFVQFNKDVPEQAKPLIEKSIELSSTKPTVGSWRWLDKGHSFNGLPSLVFRPKKPWAPNQEVSLTVHYAGLKIGDDVFGAKDVTRRFKIGDAHVVDINAKTHKLTVRENGKTVRSWGVSLGSGGDVWADGVDHLLTTSGVHLTMDRSRMERMVSPGKKKGDPGYYDEQVPWATRISNSGEYIHENTSDPSCLGNRNCSHGCVRSPAEDAKWFYHWSYRGDIVNITGTARKLDWWNGWGYWEVPFDKWSNTTDRAPVTTSPLTS
ncbi:Ig-like domain-containing protein [Spirillospora sp. NPDC052242]